MFFDSIVPYSSLSELSFSSFFFRNDAEKGVNAALLLAIDTLGSVLFQPCIMDDAMAVRDHCRMVFTQVRRSDCFSLQNPYILTCFSREVVFIVLFPNFHREYTKNGNKCSMSMVKVTEKRDILVSWPFFGV